MAKYRPEIDGLRAVAVVSVILHHFNEKILPGGFHGVDIFFVISGYVITESLLGLETESLGKFLLDFYSRRVRRLVPALVFCLVPTAILLCFVSPYPTGSLYTAVRALFGVSNFYLFQIRSDYFGESTNLNAFTQTWSLGVEEQFYLFFPLLAFATGFPSRKKDSSDILAGIVVLLGVPSLILYFQWGAAKDPASFFLMPARFWELGFGCLFFLIRNRMPNLNPTVAACFGAFTLFDRTNIAGATAMTAYLLVGLDKEKYHSALVCRLLRHPALVFVGKISYSLYLWHWSVLCLSRWTIGVSWATAPFQLCLMLGLAIFSYRFIEMPLRYARWGRANWHAVALALTSLAGCALIIQGLQANAKKLSLDFRRPSQMLLTLEDAVNWGVKEDRGCNMSHSLTKEKMEKCLLSPLPKARSVASKSLRVFVLGDSHGHHLVSGLKSNPEWDIRHFTVGSGCGIIAREDVELGGRANFHCKDYLDLVDNFVSRGLEKTDLVIVGIRWREKRKYPHQKKALELFAEQVRAHGARVLFLDDVSELWVEHPLLCEKRPWRPTIASGCEKSVKYVSEEQVLIDEMLTEIVSKNSSARYLSIRTKFCEKGVCGPMFKGEMVYSDGCHLSHAGSQIAGAAIKEFVDSWH